MKKSVYTIGSLIILLICAFVFVLLPALTGISSKQEKLPAFGKYNGKEIKYEQGTDLYNFVSYYGQMVQSQNQNQQIDTSSYYYIFNYAFNSTVLKMAYADAVDKSGYIVPNESINRSMAAYFTDETGKYSSKIYKQTPESTIIRMRKDAEGNLTSARYSDDNFGSNTDTLGTEQLFGIKESDAELDFLTSCNTNKRGFDMVVFNTNDYPTEEILKFANKNTQKFVKYDLSVITTEDESKAKTVIKRLNNNEITFADAVSEYSTKNFSNTEGKITGSYQYQVENILDNKEDISVIAALSSDSPSSIIKTTTGYSIFKKDSNSVNPDFDNETVINDVTTYINNYEMSVIEDYFVAKATDFTTLAINSNFDSACSKLSYDKITIEPTPLNYGNVSAFKTLSTNVYGLDTNETFLKTAYSLNKGDISKPIVVNKNIVVVQYTTEDNSISEEPVAFTSLSSYDENAAQNFIMDNPKLENNLSEVFFNNFVD
jgi:parvulin-like peptidyl-prolyl isomerase